MIHWGYTSQLVQQSWMMVQDKIFSDRSLFAESITESLDRNLFTDSINFSNQRSERLKGEKLSMWIPFFSLKPKQTLPTVRRNVSLGESLSVQCFPPKPGTWRKILAMKCLRFIWRIQRNYDCSASGFIILQRERAAWEQDVVETLLLSKNGPINQIKGGGSNRLITAWKETIARLPHRNHCQERLLLIFVNNLFNM